MPPDNSKGLGGFEVYVKGKGAALTPLDPKTLA